MLSRGLRFGVLLAAAALCLSCSALGQRSHDLPAGPVLPIDPSRVVPKGPVSTGAPLIAARASAVQAPRGGPFGATSVWKDDVRSAPVAPGSAAMVAHLAEQVRSRYGGVAAFNVAQHNASFYAVARRQPGVTVLWDDCQNKGLVPEGLYGPGGQFLQVPIPSDAVPSRGTDASLVIYQPSTDTMWDLWRVAERADGWHACWGGRMTRVSQAPGWFAGDFGASASGLSIIGGSILIRDATAGRIDHALALAIPNPADWQRVSWPAQRSDGFDPAPEAIPEGTRLRLDPELDVDALGLHPVAAMVARAAQRYGFIVTDRSGAVAVVTESGAATAARTGTDPWQKLLAGTPDYLVMRDFPWADLQALPHNYGKPTPTPTPNPTPSSR